MRRASIVLVVLVLATTAAAKRKAPPAPKPPAPPPTVTASVVREADGTRVDLTWDGPLLGWAIPRDGSGHRTLYTLIGPKHDDAPSTCAVDDEAAHAPKSDARLFRWREETPERLDVVASGLPNARLEAVSLDGVERLVLVRDGGIDTVGDDGTVTPLVADREVTWTLGNAREGADADLPDDRLRVALPGELRTYGRGETGAWRIASSSALPIRVAPGQRATRIETPAVHAVGKQGGEEVFATEPEPIGTTRVRTTLIKPNADPLECWAQLPAPERVLDNTFAIMDGRVVWIALTMSADKLSLFAEKTLRVYDLAADRTRVGAAPRIALATGLNIWQFGYPVVTDLDRDGRDDLVIAYWKGLTHSIAALEVYPGDGVGGLGKKRTTEVTVDDADEGFLSFGRDLDGDGRPDLAVVTKTALVVYSGTAEPLKRPIAEKPSRRVSLLTDRPGANATEVDFSLGGMRVWHGDPGYGVPRPVDLDGDGQAELLFVGNRGSGGRASIVRFRKPGVGSLASGDAIRYK